MLAENWSSQEWASVTPQSVPPGQSLELLAPSTLLPGHQPHKADPCSALGLWQGKEAPAASRHISTALTLGSQLGPFKALALLLWWTLFGAFSVPRVICNRSIPSQSQDSCGGSVCYKGFELPSVSFVPAHGFCPCARQDGEGYLS